MHARDKLVRARRFKDEGDQLYRDGHFVGAAASYSAGRALCEEALIDDRSDDFCEHDLKNQIVLNLAATQIKLCQWPQALESCSFVILRDPGNVKARYRRALARIEEKDYEGALEDLKVAQRLEPKKPAITNLMVVARNKRRDRAQRMLASLGEPAAEVRHVMTLPEQHAALINTIDLVFRHMPSWPSSKVMNLAIAKQLTLKCLANPNEILLHCKIRSGMCLQTISLQSGRHLGCYKLEASDDDASNARYFLVRNAISAPCVASVNLGHRRIPELRYEHHKSGFSILAPCQASENEALSPIVNWRLVDSSAHIGIEFEAMMIHGLSFSVLMRRNHTIIGRLGITVISIEYRLAAVAAEHAIFVYDIDSGNQLYHLPHDAELVNVHALRICSNFLVVETVDDSICGVFVTVIKISWHGMRREFVVCSRTPFQHYSGIDVQVDLIAVCQAVAVRMDAPISGLHCHRLSSMGLADTPFMVIPGDFGSVAISDSVIVTCPGIKDMFGDICVWLKSEQRCILRLSVFSFQLDVYSQISVFVGPHSNSATSVVQGAIACLEACREAELTPGLTPDQDTGDDEEVARISPAEAAHIVEEQWCTHVQSQIRSSAVFGDEGTGAHGSDCPNRAVILCFNRHPKEFDATLMQSELASSCKQRGVDIQPQWGNGAKVFVEGLRQSDLDEARVDLCPRHVIVTELEVDKVMAALEVLPYRIRPRLKTPGLCQIIPQEDDLSLFHGTSAGDGDDVSSLCGAASEVDEHHDLMELVVVERTFLTFKMQPIISPRTTRSA